MANHFSQLARKSTTNGSTKNVSKEQIGKPSLEIYKLGDDVLRKNAKRISKVDHSIRYLLIYMQKHLENPYKTIMV